MSRSLKEASKVNWQSDDTSYAAINCGSLQRIADASEMMARNYVQVQNDRDHFKRRMTEAEAQVRRLQRSVNAYRGIFRKRKK